MAGWSAHSVCSSELLGAARSKGLSDNKGVQAETLYHRDDVLLYIAYVMLPGLHLFLLTGGTYIIETMHSYTLPM